MSSDYWDLTFAAEEVDWILVRFRVHTLLFVLVVLYEAWLNRAHRSEGTSFKFDQGGSVGASAFREDANRRERDLLICYASLAAANRFNDSSPLLLIGSPIDVDALQPLRDWPENRYTLVLDRRHEAGVHRTQDQVEHLIDASVVANDQRDWLFLIGALQLF